jgi:hypothetical protein
MREKEREINGLPQSNVLTSGSPEANPKSGPDYAVFINKQTNKQTPWSESASELYRPSDRRFSAK